MEGEAFDFYVNYFVRFLLPYMTKLLAIYLSITAIATANAKQFKEEKEKRKKEENGKDEEEGDDDDDDDGGGSGG